MNDNQPTLCGFPLVKAKLTHNPIKNIILGNWNDFLVSSTTSIEESDEPIIIEANHEKSRPDNYP